jgi:hypothetical protein
MKYEINRPTAAHRLLVIKKNAPKNIEKKNKKIAFHGKRIRFELIEDGQLTTAKWIKAIEIGHPKRKIFQSQLLAPNTKREISI